MKFILSPSNLLPIVFSALLFMLALVLYYPTLTFDFAYDDVSQIKHNQLVNTQLPLLDSLKLIVRTPTAPGNLYRPVTTLTYRLNNLDGQLAPYSYHLTNTLLYGFICVLVFWTFLLSISDSAGSLGTITRSLIPAICLLSALIFTVHPVHVEAVANVVGRAELLACFFGLLAVIASKRSLTCQSSGGFWATLSLGSLFFVLAALSKESALTFALLIPMAQMWLGSISLPINTKTRPILWVISLILCSTGVLYLRYTMLGENFFVKATTPFENPENALVYFSFFERILHAFRILGDYLLLLIAPLSLSADYSLTPAQVFADTYSLKGLLAILTLSTYFLALALFRGQRVFFWGAWFFIALLLTANVLTPIGTIMGERLLFTPSIGAIYFLIYVLLHLSSRFRYGHLVTYSKVLILVCLFTYASLQRIPVWQNNQTLFRQTLIDAPRSPKATYNYAVYLRTSGEALDECQKYFMKTLELLPNHTLSMVALADIALERKSYARVEYWYKRILEIEPNNEVVKVNLEKLDKFKQEL